MSLNNSGGNPSPAARGAIKGWSHAALRRQRLWLYSVARDQRLDGHGYAITLTLRNSPASADDWHNLRRAYIRRLQRRGLTRLHWVVEWQERGVPHLHIAAYWASQLSALDQALLRKYWLEVAAEYEPRMGGQYVTEITGVAGWFQYMTKHASRGLHHYQRGGLPEGWEKSGRLWGHVGDWPTVEPVEVTANLGQFVRLRRLVVSWRVAQARAALVRAQQFGDSPQNLRSRRRALVFARRSGRVQQGVFPFPGVSEDIPEHVGLRLAESALDPVLET